MVDMIFKKEGIKLTYELTDYDVWMEFGNSRDCYEFYEWWEVDGMKSFDRWLDKKERERQQALKKLIEKGKHDGPLFK